MNDHVAEPFQSILNNACAGAKAGIAKTNMEKQILNATYAGKIQGKITLSKIIKIRDDIEKNMPEKIIERIEISSQTACILKHDYKKFTLWGMPIYMIPKSKVPYKIIYIKEQ